MIERQVIVTWNKPEDKLPPDGYTVVLTISGRHGNIIFDHALVCGSYFEGDRGGWCLEMFEDEETPGITVHAWADLEPYKGE